MKDVCLFTEMHYLNNHSIPDLIVVMSSDFSLFSAHHPSHHFLLSLKIIIKVKLYSFYFHPYIPKNYGGIFESV